MGNFLICLDKILCNYLGLDRAESIPHLVNKKGNRLTVVNTESYKRHIQETSIFEMDLNGMNKENKEKLGIAIGKAVANNLVISFDEITITKEESHAR